MKLSRMIDKLERQPGPLSKDLQSILYGCMTSSSIATHDPLLPLLLPFVGMDKIKVACTCVMCLFAFFLPQRTCNMKR